MKKKTKRDFPQDVKEEWKTNDTMGKLKLKWITVSDSIDHNSDNFLKIVDEILTKYVIEGSYMSIHIDRETQTHIINKSKYLKSLGTESNPTGTISYAFLVFVLLF